MKDEPKSVSFDPPSEVWRVVFTDDGSERLQERWFGSAAVMEAWIRDQTWVKDSRFEARDIQHVVPGEWDHYAYIVPQPTLKKVG